MRVKIKSLAEEARIIRQEAAKVSCNGFEADELRLHNKNVVGVYSRYAQLAYACIRGVPYVIVEGTARKPVDLFRVYKEAVRFGGKANADRYLIWCVTALEQINANRHRYCFDSRQKYTGNLPQDLVDKAWDLMINAANVNLSAA